MDRSFKGNKGFTLIEIIIVIVIISILGVFAFFALQNVGINLGAEAQQIANDIRYTQSLAMTKGQRYQWVKTSSTTYQIQNSSGTAIILAQGNATVTLNSGISFGTLTNLPNSLVSFDGDGRPYSTTGSPGTTLASNATIPITESGQTHTITVAAATGAVSVS